MFGNLFKPNEKQINKVLKEVKKVYDHYEKHLSKKLKEVKKTMSRSEIGVPFAPLQEIMKYLDSKKHIIRKAAEVVKKGKRI